MALDEDRCPLCDEQARCRHVENGANVECETCGRFSVDEFIAMVPSFQFHDRFTLSCLTRCASELGRPLELREGHLESLLDSAPAPHDVAARARTLLRIIARKSGRPGEHLALDSKRDSRLSYSRTAAEMGFMLHYLRELGWIWLKETMHDEECTITPAGWEAVQLASRVLSEKAFIAMWFDDSMNVAWKDGFSPAVRTDAQFRPLRIDAEQHNEMIDDRIQAEIKESRFLVADLTGHRNGVYFEAGFALGLGMPVIWTCRKDDAKQTHFDARQYNRIEWETPAELRERLAFRIRATIGIGPLRPE